MYKISYKIKNFIMNALENWTVNRDQSPAGVKAQEVFYQEDTISPHVFVTAIIPYYDVNIFKIARNDLLPFVLGWHQVIGQIDKKIWSHERMEFAIEKLCYDYNQKWKRETTERIELRRQERIWTLEEKEIY